MERQQIALVEDDPDIAEVLRYNLQREGFAVDVYSRGDSALAGIRAVPPDLLLLDLMLPGLDGLELCRLLRREPRTAKIPLIMLTAKGEETDRIVGLELGADDYIGKPFSTREVVLRIKAVLRRRAGEALAAVVPPGERLEAGTLLLDSAAHRVTVAGVEIVLTATEFKLLHFLMSRPGRVQPRTTLLTEVWGYTEGVDSRTVDTHVRRLRRKLRGEAERVETLVGVGYRFRMN